MMSSTVKLIPLSPNQGQPYQRSPQRLNEIGAQEGNNSSPVKLATPKRINFSSDTRNHIDDIKIQKDSEMKHKFQHPFRVPFLLKIVLLMVFISALFAFPSTFDSEEENYNTPQWLSIAFSSPSRNDGRIGNHALRRSSRMSQRLSDFPRVVFLDERRWNVHSRNKHTSALNGVYPIQVRSMGDISERANSINRDSANPLGNLEHSESLDNDITRYYPILDSEDIPKMERRLWPQHEFDPNCKPKAEWQSTFHPDCNRIHEADFLIQGLVTSATTTRNETLSLLSDKGFWRHAWKYDQDFPKKTSTVWKTFKMRHPFEEKFYEDNRVDAVAMERLTGSPYIIDIYGYCGLTVVQEFAERDLAYVLNKSKLDSKAKVKLARNVAQGLADIHSINENGNIDRKQDAKVSNTLVHNDLNLANLMFTADNRPILNDFNIAVLIMEHNETGMDCPFYSHFPNPQWKAPEEQVLNDEESDNNPPIVDRKIDVYALGNIFYRIIVGGSPWKRPESDKLSPEEKLEVAILKRNNGTLPSIPTEKMDEIKKDPLLAAILQAMQQCYRFDPNERPEASDIVKFLDKSLHKPTATY